MQCKPVELFGNKTNEAIKYMMCAKQLSWKILDQSYISTCFEASLLFQFL